MNNNYENIDDQRLRIARSKAKVRAFWYFVIGTVFIVIGGIFIKVSKQTETMWSPIDCQINSTNVMTNTDKNAELFQLVISYVSIINNQTYYCTKYDKQSDSYDDLNRYAEVVYPIGDPSYNCYYNDHKNETTIGNKNKTYYAGFEFGWSLSCVILGFFAVLLSLLILYDTMI